MEICEFCGIREATSGITAVHVKHGVMTQKSCWPCKDKAKQKISEMIVEKDKMVEMMKHQLL